MYPIQEELSALEVHDLGTLDSSSIQIASLESFSEGDPVEYGDGNIGMVMAKHSSSFDWPEADDETVELDDDQTVYIVARETGGAKPFEADELSPLDEAEAFGDMDEDAEPSKLEESEMGSAYPLDGVEELVSIPGVDDPGIGFDSWPDSWEDADEPARLIALRAWMNMGGTWSGCYREIKSKRICSAFKDELFGTTMWRAWDD